MWILGLKRVNYVEHVQKETQNKTKQFGSDYGPG